MFPLFPELLGTQLKPGARRSTAASVPQGCSILSRACPRKLSMGVLDGFGAESFLFGRGFQVTVCYCNILMKCPGPGATVPPSDSDNSREA